jgi:hypothetical protein
MHSSVMQARTHVIFTLFFTFDCMNDKFICNLFLHLSTTIPNARRYNWTTLFLEEINTGTWPSRLGNLKNRDNEICS